MRYSKVAWAAALAVCLGGGTAPFVLQAQDLEPPQPVLLEPALVSPVPNVPMEPHLQIPAVPEISSDPSDYVATTTSDAAYHAAPATICDAKTVAELNKRAAGAYKTLFFENDFNYLCDPCYDGCLLGENWKRMCVHDGALDLGGEYRARYHHERNMKPFLNDSDDDFLLHRLRLFANYEVNERIRVYGEMLHAVSEFEREPVRGIDENYWELQNLFVDVKLLEFCDGDLYGRAGRQELLYGNQRLVAPLDWSNIRRTFDGGKLFYRGDAWDVDAFAVRPLDKVTEEFDSSNQDQAFYGIYSTYKQSPIGAIDAYWLAYENDTTPRHYHTAGSRLFGNHGSFLYELEGAYQWGDFQGENHSAGFYTIGLGRKFDNACWKPTLWVYYDWASGDEVIGNGFDHLFPLGHTWLGWMDLFARRNIEDFNVQLTMSPRDRWTVILWYHLFHRQNSDDVPYTVVNTPYPGATPDGSRYLGQEIDLLAKYQISPRSDIVFGYSHFFTGTYFQQQNDLNPNVTDEDADFFWTQFTLRF